MGVGTCRACGRRAEAGGAASREEGVCPHCGAAAVSRARLGPSLGLLLAGGLVLFAYALWRPQREVVAFDVGWPWDLHFHWSENLRITVGAALWLLLGAWVVLSALVPVLRGRSVVTLGLASCVLVLAASDGGAGFPLHAERALPWMLAVAALGAGLALTARGRGGGAATLFVLAGSLWILAWYAAAPDVTGASRLANLAQTVRLFLEGDVMDTGMLLERAGPHLTVLLAALGGLLLVVLRARRLAMALGVLLACTVLLPGTVRVGRGLEGPLSWSSLGEQLTHGIGTALVQDGVALFVVLVFAAVDLTRARSLSA